MKVLLGSMIRELRHKKGITQEQLAESLGVSAPAISKWENELTLPDVAMIPQIASFFNVSIDILFGYNALLKQSTVERIVSEAIRYCISDTQRSIKIIQDGLREFPNDENLLNEYLYLLNSSGSDDEIIRVGSKLSAEAENDTIRYNALRFMAYAYSRKNQYDYAKKLINQLPDMPFTKKSEAAFILTGDDQYQAAYSEKWISLEICCRMCQRLADNFYNQKKIRKAINENICGMHLIEAVSDDPQSETFKEYYRQFKLHKEELEKLLT
jgi:transcriptional regulator with XRE-family HTH domain